MAQTLQLTAQGLRTNSQRRGQSATTASQIETSAGKTWCKQFDDYDSWHLSDKNHQVSGHKPAVGLSDSLNYDKVSTTADFKVPGRLSPCRKTESLIPNPHFFGRNDIHQEIEAALLPLNEQSSRLRPGKLLSSALCGMRGVGKTQIAIQFALTRKDHFDAVFWIQADDLTKFVKAISQIAVQ